MNETSNDMVQLVTYMLVSEPWPPLPTCACVVALELLTQERLIRAAVAEGDFTELQYLSFQTVCVNL
jgi:hypothetical protein